MNFILFDSNEVFEKYIDDLKEYVIERDNRMCQNCGVGTEATPHHIKYRSGSGENFANNLILLCMKCHHQIHNSAKRLTMTPSALSNKAKENDKRFRKRLV